MLSEVGAALINANHGIMRPTVKRWIPTVLLIASVTAPQPNLAAGHPNTKAGLPFSGA
jgi:hypothetical protein